MFCKYCGCTIDNDASFCPQCGKKTHTNTTVISNKEVSTSSNNKEELVTTEHGNNAVANSEENLTIALYLRYFEAVMAIGQRIAFWSKQYEHAVQEKNRIAQDIEIVSNMKYDARIVGIQETQHIPIYKANYLAALWEGVKYTVFCFLICFILTGLFMAFNNNSMVAAFLGAIAFFGSPLFIVYYLVMEYRRVKDNNKKANEIIRRNHWIEEKNKKIQNEYENSRFVFNQNNRKKIEELKNQEKKMLEAICYYEENKNKNIELIAQYYNLGYLHPSYRNIRAIVSFHHYFETGIVDKLIGLDGAYSRYDIEKKMEDIGSTLSSILDVTSSIATYCGAIVRNQERMIMETRMLGSHIQESSNMIYEQTILLSNMQNESAHNSNALLSAIENNNQYLELNNNYQRQILSCNQYLEFAKKQERLASGFFS